MKKQIEDLSINSETFNSIKEKNTSAIDIKNLKTDVLKGNSLLNYIENFEKSPFFEKKIINKGELLFDEGSLDDNIYIIKKGLLSVEKYTTSKRDETMRLNTLKSGDFLGEASIDKKSSKKEVIIKAIEKTEILLIDGKKDLKKFIEDNPTIGFEFLKYIITETNKRLLEANKLLTSNHEIEKAINSIKNIDQKNIFTLIDKVKYIIDVDYILYFEKHQIMENFLILKYDSRKPNKMQDLVFERSGYFLNLDELFLHCNIKTEDKIVINKLSIGNEVYGYLIFGRENKSFSGSDKKAFGSLSNSFVGVIKKFFTDKENIDKIYVSEMKI